MYVYIFTFCIPIHIFLFYAYLYIWFLALQDKAISPFGTQLKFEEHWPRTAVTRELVLYKYRCRCCRLLNYSTDNFSGGSCTSVLHNSILEVIDKRISKLWVSHAVSRGRLHYVGGANAWNCLIERSWRLRMFRQPSCFVYVTTTAVK